MLMCVLHDSDVQCSGRVYDDIVLHSMMICTVQCSALQWGVQDQSEYMMICRWQCSSSQCISGRCINLTAASVTAFHCIPIYFNVFYCILPYISVFHCISLYFDLFHSTALHCIYLYNSMSLQGGTICASSSLGKIFKNCLVLIFGTKSEYVVIFWTKTCML